MSHTVILPLFGLPCLVLCSFFLSLPHSVSLSQNVDTVFDHLADIHELSVALLASLEEMVEMASEMEGGSRYPQIGFCFEEFAEVASLILFL